MDGLDEKILHGYPCPCGAYVVPLWHPRVALLGA